MRLWGWVRNVFSPRGADAALDSRTAPGGIVEPDGGVWVVATVPGGPTLAGHVVRMPQDVAAPLLRENRLRLATEREVERARFSAAARRGRGSAGED